MICLLEIVCGQIPGGKRQFVHFSSMGGKWQFPQEILARKQFSSVLNSTCDSLIDGKVSLQVLVIYWESRRKTQLKCCTLVLFLGFLCSSWCDQIVWGNLEMQQQLHAIYSAFFSWFRLVWAHGTLGSLQIFGAVKMIACKWIEQTGHAIEAEISSTITVISLADMIAAESCLFCAFRVVLNLVGCFHKGRLFFGVWKLWCSLIVAFPSSGWESWPAGVYVQGAPELSVRMEMIFLAGLCWLCRFSVYWTRG